MSHRTDVIAGETVRISVEFKNLAGSPTNPTGVEFTFRDPAGTTTSYIAGTDPELVENLHPVTGDAAVGTYYVDVDIATAGVWTWKFDGSGAVEKIVEGTILATVPLVAVT